MKVFDSIKMANFILSMAYNKGTPLNMTQLQKILFICYGYYLAEKDQIFINESPKAWPFGPVFPNTQKNIKLDKITELTNPDFIEIQEEKELINKVEQILDRYGKYTATQLSNWSHAHGSPWDKTTKLKGFKWNMPIPNEFVKQYFSEFNVI